MFSHIMGEMKNILVCSLPQQVFREPVNNKMFGCLIHTCPELAKLISELNVTLYTDCICSSYDAALIET